MASRHARPRPEECEDSESPSPVPRPVQGQLSHHGAWKMSLVPTSPDRLGPAEGPHPGQSTLPFGQGSGQGPGWPQRPPSCHTLLLAFLLLRPGPVGSESSLSTHHALPRCPDTQGLSPSLAASGAAANLPGPGAGVCLIDSSRTDWGRTPPLPSRSLCPPPSLRQDQESGRTRESPGRGGETAQAQTALRARAEWGAGPLRLQNHLPETRLQGPGDLLGMASQ